MLIERHYDNLEKFFEPKRVLVVYGPRRVGKTTLLSEMLSHTKLKYKLDSGDNIRTQQSLSSQDFSLIDEYVGDYELIAIDEAQHIPNIGMALKIMIDRYPDRKIVATGSSSFDLAAHLGEPLTGRKRTITLYPISQLELLSTHANSRLELKDRVSDYLVYGSYPEVISAETPEKKIAILTELVDSYLFKDVLALESRKGTRFLIDLVKMLALQMGNEVSFNELATSLQVDSKTIERYLDLLEQTFIIRRLGSYSGNLRNEIRNKQKYYFLDNGVRNAIINQYNSLDSRNDVGVLWENFIFTERLKKRSYQEIYGNSYFWRTYEQQEVDFVEERDGKLEAYEAKWSDKNNVQAPNLWKTTYPDSKFTVVNRENYLDFITGTDE
ncbi:ATP-binding protein [Candidatus Berkelbacteria bacterium]|nr:ATP-binding protein [Candidatus Berkelbacteria bacterium]